MTNIVEQTAPSNPPPIGPRDPLSIAIVFVAGGLLLVATLRGQPLQSANDRSRWCTVWSLVERGTYHIDEIDRVHGWTTIDKVRHRDSDDTEWHFYSSKPPLLSTIVAGLYWIEKHTLGYSLTEHTQPVAQGLLVIVNVMPMFLALLSLGQTLRLLGVPRVSVRWVLAAAGLASMLTPMLTTLNNHTPAAVCLMFALSAMIRLRIHASPRGSDFAIVGLMAALTCSFELPAALFGVISFVYAATIDWKKTLKFYVPAAMLPLAAFFVTNWMCTGGIKPFYAYYGTEKYEYIHEGVPSYWMNPRGIDANAESLLIYLFHCVLGHHGILSITPLFLLTLWGWLRPEQLEADRKMRAILWIGAGLSAITLCFYLTRTQNYNYGGNSSALRWMLWLIPFWWYGMIPAVRQLTEHRFGHVLMAVLMIPSLYSVFYSIDQPWRPGWIFHRMERAGWIDYRTKIPPFSPPRFGLISSLPDRAGVIVDWVGSDGVEGQQLQIKSGAAVSVGDESGRLMTVTLIDGEGNEESTRLVCLDDRFSKGGDIVSWAAVPPNNQPDQSPPPMAFADLRRPPEWLTTRLRGLPSVRQFNAESERYLRYRTASGEVTAIRCDRGAAQVPVEHSEFGMCRHFCEAFYHPDLPFGLVRTRIRLISLSTQETVRTEVWTRRNLPGQ